jgi:AcrR family transcriptional regulator
MVTLSRQVVNTPAYGKNKIMSKRRTANRKGSLRVEDWVRAAAEAIEEGGVGAVAVEPLARKLGVTKGSFYWHFENRGALLEATLERWEKEATEAVIAAVNMISDPRERLRQLILEATDEEPLGGHKSGTEIFFSDALELAISDAADDPRVRPVLRRVSERRIDYLEECYRALRFAPEEARHRALLVYAAYVGSLRLAREAPGRMPQGDDYLVYQQHFVAAVVPDGE